MVLQLMEKLLIILRLLYYLKQNLLAIVVFNHLFIHLEYSVLRQKCGMFVVDIVVAEIGSVQEQTYLIVVEVHINLEMSNLKEVVV